MDATPVSCLAARLAVLLLGGGWRLGVGGGCVWVEGGAPHPPSVGFLMDVTQACERRAPLQPCGPVKLGRTFVLPSPS